MHHNYWACSLEPRNRNYWTHMPQLLKPERPRACALQEKPLRWETCAPQLENSPWLLQLEKSLCSNKDPAQPINKSNYLKKKKKRNVYINGITLSAYVSWECFLLAQPYSINLYIWSPQIKKKERKEEESWGGGEEREKSKLVKERTREEQLEILSMLLLLLLLSRFSRVRLCVTP